MRAEDYFSDNPRSANDDPLPKEIIIIQLADRFKQPFEYFEKLDVAFMRKLFVIVKAENDEYKKKLDDSKKDRR